MKRSTKGTQVTISCINPVDRSIVTLSYTSKSGNAEHAKKEALKHTDFNGLVPFDFSYSEVACITYEMDDYTFNLHGTTVKPVGDIVSKTLDIELVYIDSVSIGYDENGYNSDNDKILHEIFYIPDTLTDKEIYNMFSSDYVKIYAIRHTGKKEKNTVYMTMDDFILYSKECTK